jgi:glycosyltransferase involved in cell wall biosynthesis
MFFSVIVTIYNGEAFLAPCLDSILMNAAGNYELIIVDDGSTDKTGKICDDYATRYDQVECVHTENQGIGNARQAGLDVASGEYVIFVDGDDVWDESFCLRRMEEIIRGNLADLYVFGYVLRRMSRESHRDSYFTVEASSFDDWRDSQSRFLSYFPNGLMFLCWNKIFRRQCIVNNGVMSVNQHMEDFRFVLEFLKYAKKVVFLPEMPYIHVKRGDQDLSSTLYQGMLDGYNCCHNLFLSLFDNEYTAVIHQIMAPAYIATIDRHLGFIDSHKEEEIAKDVLQEVYNNELAKQSFIYYRPNSLSERVSFFLMRNGRFGALRLYRKAVRTVKRLVG